MAPPPSTTPVLVALLFFVAACLAETVSLRGAFRDRILALSNKPTQVPVKNYQFLPPVSPATGESSDDLELLDICLVASVDGKFHALNRVTGQTLWSTQSSPAASTPAALRPLVRTQHGDYNPDDDEDKEIYIIEPQTGQIFILHGPDEPLHRLPVTMSQLVDLSPFSFTGEENLRRFVGKKETSLLVIELETGRVKATINSECPWDPFGDFDDEQSKADIDLDDLDGTKSQKDKPVSTEVLIGRTDYHVSIHTKSPISKKATVQNLSFSRYGPNNQDHEFQSTYVRTLDDMYIQALPDGEILSFRAGEPPLKDMTGPPKADSQLLWGNSFQNPIVAVFDVLKSSSRQNPFVLLQPHARLQDVIYNAELPSSSATFVGLVDDIDYGSLFAMSPEQYPLLAFPAAGRGFNPLLIDAPPGSEYPDLPTDVDSVTRMRKERERCLGKTWDMRCLTGKRPVDTGLWKHPLIDGVPSVPTMAAFPKVPFTNSGIQPNTNVTPGAGEIEGSVAGPYDDVDPVQALRRQVAPAVGATVAFALFLVGLWYFRKKQSNQPKANGSTRSIELLPFTAPDLKQNGNPTLPNGNGHIHTPSDGSEASLAAEKPLPDPPSAPPTPSQPSTPSAQKIKFVTASNLPKSPKPDSSEQPQEDGDGDEDSEREEDQAQFPVGKKKTRRRTRGKKKKSGSVTAVVQDDPLANLPPVNGTEKPPEDPPAVAITPLQPTTPKTPAPPLLTVSDEVLGFGSHGTVVFRGALQGRAVAVKRLLQDFITLASREVAILQESDDHPNVIRYFYQEGHANFLYIALELCPASLADIVERPDLPAHRTISNSFDPKRALREVAAGLRHLHALKIIHRDIKPQNILISAAKQGAGSAKGHRMLISDFGLCKKLEVDQTSFLPTAHGAMAAGTVGWRAPEILRGDVKLDEPAADDQSQSSRSSTSTVNGSHPKNLTRLTKSVDIFALGCLFYYTLTAGGHPYGDRFEREANIMKDAKVLTGLETFGEEGLEAVDLITKMLDPDASKRPDTAACLTHPFFWNPARRLAFLQDASDRFEIMCRDPPEPDLLELEKGAFAVVGNDWHSRLDKVFIENLGKFRKYNGRSVQDLMRALRNKKHHYQDLPDNVKRHLGPLPDGFLAYFTRRFPQLFMHVHNVVSRTNLCHESMFKSYFEVAD